MISIKLWLFQLTWTTFCGLKGWGGACLEGNVELFFLVEGTGEAEADFLIGEFGLDDSELLTLVICLFTTGICDFCGAGVKRGADVDLGTDFGLFSDISWQPGSLI